MTTIRRLYQQAQRAQLEPESSELRALLAHHYGDGSVYVPQGISPRVIQQAKAQGLIDEEGYLTREGRRFLLTAEDDTALLSET